MVPGCGRSPSGGQGGIECPLAPAALVPGSLAQLSGRREPVSPGQLCQARLWPGDQRCSSPAASMVCVTLAYVS